MGGSVKAHVITDFHERSGNHVRHGTFSVGSRDMNCRIRLVGITQDRTEVNHMLQPRLVSLAEGVGLH